jgi:hypothetical protein
MVKKGFEHGANGNDGGAMGKTAVWKKETHNHNGLYKMQGICLPGNIQKQVCDLGLMGNSAA